MAVTHPPSAWLLPAAVACAALVVGVLAGINPLLALAGAGGILFVFVAIADLTVGLCLFILVGILEVLPAVGGQFLSLAKLLGLLLAVSWLAAITTGERGGGDLLSKHPALSSALGLFLAWAALSLAWAESTGDGLAAIVRYVPNVILLLIVYAAVRERRHIVWTAAAFASGAAITAMYGILLPPDEPTSIGSLERFAGTIGDPNEFAALLLTGLVFALALWPSFEDFPMLRIAAAGAAALCVLGVLLSVSRGGLVALACMFLASLFVAGRWRPAVLAVGLVLGTAVLGYYTFVAAPDAAERIVEAEGGSGRVDIWKVGWRMFEDQPAVGVGVGNYGSRSIDYVLEPGALPRGDLVVDAREVAHNVYLHIAAELGVVGLLLFLAVVGASLWCTLRAARAFEQHGDPAMELIARGLFLALVGVLVTNFFLSEQFGKQLWLLIALGPALLYVARSGREEAIGTG